MKYFAGLIKLPMSYHMCTGMEVPVAYNSASTEKCDSDNKTFDDLVSNVYFITHMVFGSMVVYERIIQKRNTGHNDPQSRFHVILNNKLFFLRMTFCITTYQVCSLINCTHKMCFK